MRTKEEISAYQRKYRESNREKLKKYYESNRLRRIEKATQWRINNLERSKETRRKYRKTPKGRLNSIKASAKTRDIPYRLDDGYAVSLMENPCHYCGQKKPVGIDRVDSNLAYEIGNCVPCCDMCNYMKKDFKIDDFISQCKIIAKNHATVSSDTRMI